jgi:quercetin dioxygenase-like cupin family protein
VRLALPHARSAQPIEVRPLGDALHNAHHCLEGKLEITCGNASHRLNAGELLYLLGGVEHGVLAHENSSALVTIALRKS